MILSDYDVFLLYIRVKLHFTQDRFDFFKSPIRMSVDIFNKRNDKKLFKALSRKATNKLRIINYFVSGYVETDKNYLLDFLSHETGVLHKNRMSRIKNIKTVFQKDVMEIYSTCGSMERAFETGVTGFPYLLKMVMEKRVTLESLIILNEIYKFLDSWKLQYETNIVVSTLLKKTTKYRVFLGKINSEMFSKYLQMTLTKEDNRIQS